MSTRAEFQARRDRDSSTFDNSYQTLGIALTDPSVLVLIQNNSNVDVDLSTDGVTDHSFVAKSSFVLFDLRANRGHSYDLAFAKEVQFYIKGAAAGSGDVMLTVIQEA